jgi:hypothetical protein
VHAAQPQPPGLAPAQGLVLNEVQYERFSGQPEDRVEKSVPLEPEDL